MTKLLQSPDKPHVIYSWAGGVLREQVKAGVIEDISDAVNAGGWKDRFSPSALNLYAVDGRTYGLPMLTSRYRGVVLPQVALNRDALCPWRLGIMAFQGEFSTDWHLVLAFITLTIAPMVLLFFAAQRHIVAGLTAGAVKG